MNHKRGRPKGRRAGCLMCKPNKLGQGMENDVGHKGYGRHVKREKLATIAMKEVEWKNF